MAHVSFCILLPNFLYHVEFRDLYNFIPNFLYHVELFLGIWGLVFQDIVVEGVLAHDIQ